MLESAVQSRERASARPALLAMLVMLVNKSYPCDAQHQETQRYHVRDLSYLCARQAPWGRGRAMFAAEQAWICKPGCARWAAFLAEGDSVMSEINCPCCRVGECGVWQRYLQ